MTLCFWLFLCYPFEKQMKHTFQFHSFLPRDTNLILVYNFSETICFFSSCFFSDIILYLVTPLMHVSFLLIYWSWYFDDLNLREFSMTNMTYIAKRYKFLIKKDYPSIPFAN